ncbi:hypothetical protein QRB41_14975 [Mycobacterium avium subsp. hominissuis]|uniref:Uncharacterized protein n=1 Tax=Mycobacterium intracellulare subsp. chimaera TaxID=222805 RepID=A0ABT7P3E4_MYCIT|nr:MULTISPECIES: hypothetical protein [Mycobacterium avium complex (MAC)]MDM3927801.1 hypothetical protein [Mycobacterium intracellulare subsp. chimaera]MDO2384670.1 hypothetical protein [Mycobacterium avium subsp. hominissuis]
MPDFSQRDDDAVPPVFIAVDEYAQFKECLTAEGARVANEEAAHSLREIFTLARSHRIRITAGVGTPTHRRGHGRGADRSRHENLQRGGGCA